MIRQTRSCVLINVWRRDKLMNRIVRAIMRTREKARLKKYRFRYNQLPDSFALRYIDPSNVDYLLSPRFQLDMSAFGYHIKGGKWDKRYTDKSLMYANNYERKFSNRHLIKFENYELYNSLEKHFKENTPWTDTDIYEWFLENKDKNIDHYKGGIIDRLHDLDNLYESIKVDGYQPQINMADSPKIPEFHEVLVNIGRDGEIIFDDGRHRFIIAKILGVDTIPVRILVRHSEWQIKRDEIAQGTNRDLKEKYKNHPDVSDII
jgi:hypothetical protein